MTLASQVRKIAVNGVELSYVEEGNGESVVMVHGYFGDYRTWAFQMGPFAKTYRTIAYSLRYNYPHKGTAVRSDRAQIDHTDDLIDLIEELRLKPSHVLSGSYGGVVALRLARHRPDLVRSLVLAEPGLLSWFRQIPGGSSILLDLMAKFAGPAKQATRDGDLDKAMKLIVEGFIGPGLYDMSPESSKRAMKENVHLATAYNFDDKFSRQDAGKIEAPSLLLVGEKSPKMYHMIADELAHFLPNVDRATIPGAAHVLNTMNPVAYNEIVLGFLAKH